MDTSILEKMKERLAKNESIDDSMVPTKSKTSEGVNTLGLVIYSVIFGLALSSLGPYGKSVLKFFRCFSQIMMIISNWVMWLAPVGIFCLLAGQVLEVGDLHDTFHLMRMYVFTVLLGLLTHGMLVLPVLYFVICGSHPFKVIGNASHALLTAFGTSSSTATLPATVSCMEDKSGVDPRIARSVLPIGAVMNMDGTALYEAVAALFLAQLNGISLDFGSIIAVSLFATIASVGASGIPHAGIITMTMLMNALGLPAENIAFLIPVDFLLHRCRTTINVLGDTLGASLVDTLCKEELAKLPIECSTSISYKDVSRSTSTEEV
jgi:Na+/H+-dicarboxylate symporter